jgi:hypothetical protein
VFATFTIIGLALVAFAVVAIWMAARNPGVVSMFVATLSLFSLGYYALPLFFRSMSPLRSVAEDDVSVVAGMALLYLVCVVAGLMATIAMTRSMSGLQTPHLDGWASRNWWLMTIAAAAIYIAYIWTNPLTSYAAEDFKAYFENRSPLAAITAFLSTFALAVLSLSLAISIRERSKGRFALLFILFAYIEFTLIGGAQRLLFITPMLMVFVSLVAMRQYRTASLALGVGVIALLVISPFAVALRSTRTGEGENQFNRVGVSYDRGVVETTVQSIVDRADLLPNMVRLKSYTDYHGYVGPTFYKSVLVTPIPRAIYPDKPYVLSETGKPNGEASIIAWRIIVGGGTGSLTAFGPIVAYRQGGWPAVIVDGLAAGGLFALCLTFFSRGGYFGRAFLPMAFIAFAVAKSPASFFEALVAVLTYLPLVLILLVIEFVASTNAGRPGKPYYGVR